MISFSIGKLWENKIEGTPMLKLAMVKTSKKLLKLKRKASKENEDHFMSWISVPRSSAPQEAEGELKDCFGQIRKLRNIRGDDWWIYQIGGNIWWIRG